MLTMIAVVPHDTRKDEFCVIRWTGKTGIASAGHETWCGNEQKIGEAGVLQMPSNGIKIAPCCQHVIDVFVQRFQKASKPSEPSK